MYEVLDLSLIGTILLMPGISLAVELEEANSCSHAIYFIDENDPCPSDDEKSESQEPPRRALPAPFQSPPFPSAEYQGSPLIGVPPSDTVYPLMKAIYKTPYGEEIKQARVKAYGWLNGSGNLSTCRNSNTPDSYWIVPNRFEFDQFIFRVEREVNSVQTEHMDVGFRSTFLYGMDYRYMTAGGWTSSQLLKPKNGSCTWTRMLRF